MAACGCCLFPVVSVKRIPPLCIRNGVTDSLAAAEVKAAGGSGPCRRQHGCGLIRGPLSSPAAAWGARWGAAATSRSTTRSRRRLHAAGAEFSSVPASRLLLLLLLRTCWAAAAKALYDALHPCVDLVVS